jgi:hypothetical protein
MHEMPYHDELLADRTVHRRYADGREEWRARSPSGVVTWRDNRGGAGTDELLGKRIIKRRFSDGRVVYARDVGYGRTLWSDGFMTVNRTSFGGRLGVILGAIAGGVLLAGTLTPPPDALTMAEEEELRRQAQAASGGNAEVSIGGSWSDGGDDGDDDFG